MTGMVVDVSPCLSRSLKTMKPAAERTARRWGWVMVGLAGSVLALLWGVR